MRLLTGNTPLTSWKKSQMISNLNGQSAFLENKDRIGQEIKKYPNVISVGVGLKETQDEITSTLCYRIYVNEKKDLNSLKENERIPALIDGFVTDVITYGVIDQIADTKVYRPLKGGIQIKNDSYVDKDKRGGGTLGCLAILNDENFTDEIVGLTCDHVVYLNSQISDDPTLGSGNIGQPYKHICCCCCVKNIVGTVLDSKKDGRLDCAIIELHEDIINEIKAKGTINEIHEIGFIKGKALASAMENTLVKKRGAATGLTHGKVVDIAFDDHQILIAPLHPTDKFADFGDSGSIVVDENNRVIGLLWGTKRDRFKSDDFTVPDEDPNGLHNRTHFIKQRVHGVATPIDAVETALNIKIPVPPPVTPTISIHTDDTKTHVIPSTLPASKNPKQHFLTVKGEGDVILKVTFDHPVENDRIRWVSDYEEIIFPAIAGDNSTAKISRNVEEGSRSKVGVTVDGYGVGEKVLVWIIWSEARYEDLEPPLEVKSGPTEIKTTRMFRIEYKIQPQEIFPANIDEDDVPDLRGPNITPPPGVPDTDTEVFNHGVDLSGSVKYKWDTTVSLKYKIKNTDNFFIDPQLPFSKAFPLYPSAELVGNYETSTDSWEQDPYTALPHFRGEIGKTVVIEHSLPHSIAHFQGDIGESIQFLLNHKVFARVELNGTWYLISDVKLGYIQLKYKVKDEWHDFVDYNNDGDKLDKIWVGDLGVNDCFYFIGNADDF